MTVHHALLLTLLAASLAAPARAEEPAPTGAAPTPRRPQDPLPPFPYTSEEVTVRSGELRLAGTLTLPPGEGPFPAALLITGSGPQDRDEALLGHRPFLVLSDALTRAGIATLRLDDRGVGGSDAGPEPATTAELAEDCLAAVAFLRADPRIRAAQVGLIGHSEGGLIGPLAASRSEGRVAFVVMLAGPGVPGHQVLVAQMAAVARAAGLPAEAIDRQRAAQERLIAHARDGASVDQLRADLRALAEAQLSAGAEAPPPAELERRIDGQLRFFQGRWMRFFLAYDPRPALRELKATPLLALNGELDLQVLADQNLPAIEDALQAAGNPDVTIVRLPGLNHLFQTARSGSPSEYATIEETIAPAVLTRVCEWIQARCPR